MQKVCIDTNAYSQLLKGSSQLQETLEQAHVVCISVVCIGELLAGFKLGSKEKENKILLEKFISQPTVEVLEVTSETAEFYAEVFAQLRKNGTPIPLNDVWIAAHTFQSGSVLLTLDKHFAKIPGLRIWSPTQ
jgi:tRNA(fMet)-specific endonuclease VapC